MPKASPRSSSIPWRRLAPLATAALVYVTIGVLSPSFMLSWPVAAAYFIGVLWGVPATLRLVRNR